MQEYKNILVAVDGSKSAEKALKKGVEIAKQNKAHLNILNIIDLKQYSLSFGGLVNASGDIIYQSFKDENQYLEKIKQKIVENGFENVSIHVRYGAPNIIIAREFPKEHNVDLIVMGKTGVNAVERLFMGSVTEYVIRNSTCDVYIAS